MHNSNPIWTKMFFLVTFSIANLCVWGSAATTGSRAADLSTKSNEFNSSDCNRVEYSAENVTLLDGDRLYVKTENITVHFIDYQQTGDRIMVCLSYQHSGSKEIVLNCTDKFVYESDEFEILPNESVSVHGLIISPGMYKLKGDELLTCAPDYEDYSDMDDVTRGGITLGQVSIYIGIINSFISIISLTAHLFIFCFVPALRNLPGYNLASLSVAFLLGYSFALIGQIPEVLGLFCVISGVLQMNFFLTAFFCMNILAFDVWRTLKLATEKLAVGSQNTRKRQFIWYSLYAWGCPLVISIISVIVDNSDSFPDRVKPYYGAEDTCWMTNNVAKTIFFVAPAFTLVAVNGIFFVRSSMMISNNTMKCTNDQSSQTVKLNYILYVRLGLMMGLTWLMGVVALIFKSMVLWFISDILNSLQGLFLFLLFTCTKKVLRVLRERTSKKGVSDKETTLSSNSNNFTSKH